MFIRNKYIMSHMCKRKIFERRKCLLSMLDWLCNVYIRDKYNVLIMHFDIRFPHKCLL